MEAAYGSDDPHTTVARKLDELAARRQPEPEPEIEPEPVVPPVPVPRSQPRPVAAPVPASRYATNGVVNGRSTDWPSRDKPLWPPRDGR